MNAIWAYPTSDKNVEYPGKDLIQRDMIIVRKK
jgi:hypothetical protein